MTTFKKGTPALLTRAGKASQNLPPNMRAWVEVVEVVEDLVAVILLGSQIVIERNLLRPPMPRDLRLDAGSRTTRRRMKNWKRR